jgi:hypothetical protein
MVTLKSTVAGKFIEPCYTCLVHQRRQEKEELTQWAGEKLSDPDNLLPNFPDWDNPEDEDEAPDGYYDDDEWDEDDDGYVPDESDPDFDLSEAAGYAGYEEPAYSGPVPQWMITTFAVVVIVAILFGVIAVLR